MWALGDLGDSLVQWTVGFVSGTHLESFLQYLGVWKDAEMQEIKVHT